MHASAFSEIPDMGSETQNEMHFHMRTRSTLTCIEDRVILETLLCHESCYPPILVNWVSGMTYLE